MATLSWWEFLLWGALGGLLIEGMDFYNALKNSRQGKWPTHLKWTYGVAVIVRLGIRRILAMALGTDGSIRGVTVALAVGAGAPAIIERLARIVPRLPSTNGDS